MSKALQVAVALLLTVLLLYFVVDVREVGRVLAGVHPGWTVITLLAITCDRTLMSFKWLLLLRSRGHRIPLAHAVMVYCSAMVWGLALPSTLGADAIRAMLIRRRGVAYNDSVATIMVERGIGFVSALGMGLLGVVTLRILLPGAGQYDLLLLAGATLMTLAIAVLLLSFTERAFDVFMSMVPARWRQAGLVARMQRLHDTYRSLASDRRTLVLFALLTSLQQAWFILLSVLIARSLSIEVNELYFVAAVPLAFLAARLPVSFDGIGIYEGIFVAVMSLAGLSPAQSFAIALCGRIFNLITWLPWFLAFLLRGGSLRREETSAAG
jgi:uncharacterized protein (TIRG00374 family)